MEATLTMGTSAGRNEYRFALAHAQPDRLMFVDEAFRFTSASIDTDRSTPHVRRITASVRSGDATEPSGPHAPRRCAARRARTRPASGGGWIDRGYGKATFSRPPDHRRLPSRHDSSIPSILTRSSYWRSATDAPSVVGWTHTSINAGSRSSRPASSGRRTSLAAGHDSAGDRRGRGNGGRVRPRTSLHPICKRVGCWRIPHPLGGNVTVERLASVVQEHGRFGLGQGACASGIAPRARRQARSTALAVPVQPLVDAAHRVAARTEERHLVLDLFCRINSRRLVADR